MRYNVKLLTWEGLGKCRREILDEYHLFLMNVSKRITEAFRTISLT